jgi:hypothetical protein
LEPLQFHFFIQLGFLPYGTWLFQIFLCELQKLQGVIFIFLSIQKNRLVIPKLFEGEAITLCEIDETKEYLSRLDGFREEWVKPVIQQ